MNWLYKRGEKVCDVLKPCFDTYLVWGHMHARVACFVWCDVVGWNTLCLQRFARGDNGVDNETKVLSYPEPAPQAERGQRANGVNTFPMFYRVFIAVFRRSPHVHHVDTQ